MKLKASLALAFGLIAGMAHSATELVIATVNNGHMIEMQKHSKAFEAANPGITLKWVTLEEGVLRQRVTTDIATKGGQFDVMTITNICYVKGTTPSEFRKQAESRFGGNTS